MRPPGVLPGLEHGFYDFYAVICQMSVSVVVVWHLTYTYVLPLVCTLGFMRCPCVNLSEALLLSVGRFCMYVYATRQCLLRNRNLCGLERKP